MNSDSGRCFMMLWDQLPKEQLAQVRDVYSENNFPLEVRLQLAGWIEEKFVPLGSPNPSIFKVENEQHQELIAAELLQQLDDKVEAIPNEPDKFLMKSKLQEISENLKCSYGGNLCGLYMVVRSCLEAEMRIVSQIPDMLQRGGTDCGDIGVRIKQQLTFLKQGVQETGLQLDKCRQEQEAFSVEYYAYRESSSRFEAMVQLHGENHQDVVRLKLEKEGLKKGIQQKYANLSSHQSTLFRGFVSIYHQVKEVQLQVLDKELINWKREQRLAGNGYPLSNNLDVLQEWCEGLADVIWTTRQQVRQLEGLRAKLMHDPQNNDVNIGELLASVTELLSNLVTGTFIIEKQPPQVMKTNTRFTATVRLLVGSVLNVHMAAPAVSVSIVSESQANQLLMSPSTIPKRKEDYNSGDILNNQGTMEFHSTTKQVSCSFRNLQLKKIKRTEKKGTESVMDEKFSVLFWTEFKVSELKFQLWTFSLPVVVIVHGNQEPQALATVVWDNGFSEWGRKAFYVPDKVTWGQAGAVLNMKWASACGRELTEDNLYYLACKALRNNNLTKVPEEYNSMILTWSLFCKEPLPDRTFTFWEWFYRLLLLTSNHMQRLWKEGCIMGFVNKQAAESMLLQKQNGCFLLRFSDSELGGVTIAYVKVTEFPMEASVFSLYPFSTRDLSQRSMADVIFDIKELTILYPDVPKETFRKFCSNVSQGQTTPNANGYVKHTLVTQVEGTQMGAESNPATPLPYEFGMNAQDALSPNYLEGMDIATDIDIADCIDVRQILQFTEDQYQDAFP